MKRLFDLIVIFILLPFIFLLCFVIAFFVKIKLGSPVIFSQPRPGLNGNIFNMNKFRTMTNNCDLDGNLLPENLRSTKFGKILRSTSLDELPALWNVIKGSMSLVGPRPLLVQYLPLYNENQFRRHEVLPGITGWAQVNGRNTISWDEKFNLDLWYVDNQSMWLDLKILCLTVKKVIMRDGINQENQVTSEYFKGNNIEN